MVMFLRKENQTQRNSHSCLYQVDISLHPHTGFTATSTYNEAVADSQMRATQSKLPFTYRTFGVSDAQPQSHYSQHADCCQHLLGGDSARGRRRTTATSFLFSPLFHCLSFSFSFPPSPSYSTPRVLSSLFQQRGNSSVICGTRLATWSTRRIPGTSNAPRRTGPCASHRTAGCVDGGNSN